MVVSVEARSCAKAGLAPLGRDHWEIAKDDLRGNLVASATV